jgi:ABC-type nitrate/sulfonate/bicarbonate transport system substrate-binding protein
MAIGSLRTVDVFGGHVNIYLAGKIKNCPDYRTTFAKAAQQLRIDGHCVFNPAAANLEGLGLRKIMAYELTWLCEYADAIAVLPGWKKSKGTKAELAAAYALGLQIIYL